jgi:hypothetical protein
MKAHAKRKRTKAHAKPNRVQEGRYANYFEVGHNPFEFYLNFGQYDPASKNAQMHTCIVTGPAYAKMLLDTLSSSVQNFEYEHGDISMDGGDLDATEMVQESLSTNKRREEEESS